MMRQTLTAAVVLLCASLSAHGQSNAAKLDIGIDQHLQGQLPLELKFRTEQGEAVPIGSYFGSRPVILVLAYYRCPRLCNIALNNLASSLAKLNYRAGRDFEVVIVSIDPRETPELAAAKKAAIIEHYAPPGAEAGWHFLTGAEPDIQRLAQAVGFRYAYDADRDLYAHASGVMVLTPDGKIARYFFGIEYSPRDFQFGLEDASAGKIGSPITQPLRLLCFAYDPDAGSYTLMTMRLVQIGAAVTVAVLGIFLVRAWRRPAIAVSLSKESASAKP
jgi:protein SCO1